MELASLLMGFLAILLGYYAASFVFHTGKAA